MMRIHLKQNGILGKLLRLIAITTFVFIIVQFVADECSHNQKIIWFKDRYVKIIWDNYFMLY